MKRSNIILLLSIISLLAYSQKKLSLTQGKPTFVYSLPKIQLEIEVQIEKTIQNPGQFYQYSQKYLATSQVIVEPKTTYRIKNVRINSFAIPDPNRTFTFENSKGVQSNFITVNSIGLLCGVNVPCQNEKVVYDNVINTIQNKLEPNNLLLLGEEYMMAGSTAKLAEGVAKQIYRIRESRMLLLSGDMDKMPSDGKALSTMLEGLDKTETELTELFIGKITTESTKHHIYFTPDSAVNNSIIFRFSALRGLVTTDDLGGAPYFINVIPTTTIEIVPPGLKDKIEKTVLNTVLPITTTVTITDGIRTYFENKVEMPQFGVLMPISESVFKMPKVKIAIDSNTGRLLGVTK